MVVNDIESFWAEFLSYVESRSVIAVVGPNLALVEHGSERLPYQQLLARQLAAQYQLKELSETPTLHETTRAWLARPGAKRQALYRELGELASKNTVAVPEPMRQLARIQDLDLFASFCPDDLLTRALNEERHHGQPLTTELAFTPSESNDLPPAGVSGSLVYYLFGRLSILPKYVAAEEDILEWVSALQSPNKRPERLFDELGRNHLLVLGCDFPDWLARFVLRTTKNSKLSVERDFSEYLVDGHVQATDPLVVFLSNYSRGTQILPQDPAAFVAEFERRWQVRNVNDEQPAWHTSIQESAPAGSVFISYASEDRSAALRLAEDLQAQGLPVWLDRQQLDWGSDYTARIQRAIGQCALFVPVLSRHAEQRVGFFRREWAWAADRNLEFTGASLRFLFPLVVDDLSVFSSTEIPDAFKRVPHVETAPGGAINARQHDAIATAYRTMKRRLEQRS